MLLAQICNAVQLGNSIIYYVISGDKRKKGASLQMGFRGGKFSCKLVFSSPYCYPLTPGVVGQTGYIRQIRQGSNVFALTRSGQKCYQSVSPDVVRLNSSNQFSVTFIPRGDGCSGS